MAPKKRKSKKNRTQERQKFLKKSCSQLIAQGDKAVSSGDYRNAILCFQTALKHPDASKDPIPIQTKLFQAYYQRALELDAKGMTKEATAMKKQALAAAPEVKLLAVDDMIAYLNLCDLDRAFTAYLEYVDAHGNTPKLEHIPADFFISKKCWKYERRLPQDALLKRGIPIMKKSVPFMDQGKWSNALAVMKSLPRSSPFAHARLFCRAMIAFNENNDADFKKAVSMLPPTSILMQVADKMRVGIELERLGNATQTALTDSEFSVIRELWDGPFNIDRHLNTLIKFDREGRYTSGMGNAIKQIAKQISPKDTKPALLYIVETVADSSHSRDNAFFKMAQKVIGTSAEMVRDKIAILTMENPLKSAFDLFTHFEKEFTDPEERAIAKSMIICRLATTYYHSAGHMTLVTEPSFLKDHFKIGSSHWKEAVLELILFGIELDPRNRNLYELAKEIRIKSRNEKKLMESIWDAMADTWPDDAEPCLRLATLYHTKGAYRKAENILKKAAVLAPHDTRVVDMQVISLLIATDRNAGNNRFHLVWPDFEKARETYAPKCRLLLGAKQILYKALETGKLNHSEMEKVLTPFSLSDQLRMILMLIKDIDDKTLGNKSRKKLKKEAKESFNKTFKQLNELSSLDILAVLQHLPSEWRNLYNEFSPLMTIPGSPGKLLSRLEDTHLFSLVHSNNDFEMRTLRSEINRRAEREPGKKATAKEWSDWKILEFYRITLENISGGPFSVFNAYEDYMYLLEDIDPETENRLKQAASQLSSMTFGPLQAALDRFDFEILAPPPFPSSPLDFLDDDWDDDDWDDDDWDDDDEWDDDDFFDSLFGGKRPSPFDFGSPKGGRGKKGKATSGPLIPGLPFEMDEIGQMADMIRQILNTREGQELKKILDQCLDDLEHVVDMEGLRGKSDAVLQKARKRFLKDPEIKLNLDMINACYKPEARKKLSKEAKTLFLS